VIFMARINIRELPDHIHKAISDSAERNNRSTEGEVRSILQSYVSSLEVKPAPIETLRQSWQKGVGNRLDQLFACVRKDQVFGFGDRQSLVGIARTIGEDTPAHLLDCMEGIASPSFEMLDRVVAWSGGSYEWLVSGLGTVFPVENLGNDYHDFFLHDRKSKHITFHLLRVCGGRCEGMLLCFRHDSVKQTYASGYMYANFNLKGGMGSGGHHKLSQFIRFLKTQCGDRAFKAYNYEETEVNTEQGTHHPVYYIRAASTANWLRMLFDGQDPDDWLEGYRSAWKEIADLPFGNGEPE
jgi:plasmid stability protein